MSKSACFLAWAAIFLTGCTTLQTDSYVPSQDNQERITKFNKTVGIGDFRPNYTYESQCRGVGHIRPPGGVSIEAYIRQAFIDEFKAANAYKENAPITLSASIDEVQFSSSKSVVNGEWSLKATISSSNGKNLTVSEVHEFTAGFFGTSACDEVALQFSKAVQSLVKKVLMHPEFATLIR